MNFDPAPKKYPTWADIPRWQDIARKVTIGHWHKWFAWYPVKIHNERVWLKTVYRRKVTRYVDMDSWSIYEYGTVFDLLIE